MSTVISREQLVTTTRSFIGTPFHHQGRLKHVGVDCVGLLVCVARELGIPHEDYTTYSRWPNGELLLQLLEANCKRIAIDEAKPGDILLFRISKRGTQPKHAGILTDYGMIHTYVGPGRVVEHVLSESWRRRIVGAYRFPLVGD